MDEFLIQLQAILDKAKSEENIKKGIDRMQHRLDKLKIQTELDPKAAQKLANDIGKLLNQKIVISNIGIDTGQAVKNAQQSGQQIGNAIDQGIKNEVGKVNNTLKSFADLKNFSELNKSIKPLIIDTSELKNYQNILNKIKETYAGFGQVKITNESFNNGILEKFRVNIEQVNGDLKETKSFMMSLNDTGNAFVFNGVIKGSESIVQHLDKTKNAINQTADAINNLKLKTQTDKIQLSMGDGTYESKVDALVAKTMQWTDVNGNARISTNELSNAFDQLTTASNNYANSPTEAHQKALIASEKELDNQIKTVTNSVKSMNAELAKDSKISSLHNQLADFMGKNGKAVKYFGNDLRDIFNQTGQGAKLTNQELAVLKQRFIDIQNTARNTGKLGKTWFQTLREGMSSFSYWTSSTFLVMKAIQSIKGGIRSVVELDTALVDLRKTTTMTYGELEKFYYRSNEVAKQAGVTTAEIINQAAAWSRLGYSSEEAASKMAKYSSMFSSISPGMNVDTATDGLVSIMKAFDIGNDNPDDVLDGIMSKINMIGNTAATSNAEIVNMLTRSSSAMKEANNTLEETIALETAAVEITRDDASVGMYLPTNIVICY